MSNQQDVNWKRWPRCRDVILRDGVLHCTLDQESTYVFIKGYKSNPHVQFANAETDRALIAFLRRWGPPFLNPGTPGVMDIRLEAFRAQQQWFRALLGVLHTFGRGEKESEALRTLIEAECRLEELLYGGVLPETKAEEFSGLLSALKEQFHIHGNVLDWIEGIDPQTIRAASACVIEHLPIRVGTHLVCTRRRIEAGWNLYDLSEALRWMVWYDFYTQHPLICCPECRRVKRAKTTRGNQKFCSYKCAHRAAARAWQRKHYKSARRK